MKDMHQNNIDPKVHALRYFLLLSIYVARIYLYFYHLTITALLPNLLVFNTCYHMFNTCLTHVITLTLTSALSDATHAHSRDSAVLVQCCVQSQCAVHQVTSTLLTGSTLLEGSVEPHRDYPSVLAEPMSVLAVTIAMHDVSV